MTGGGGMLGGLFGLLGSAGSAVYGKRMYDISKADWENIFEEYIAPEIRHQRKVYWPVQEAVGPTVTQRMYESPQRYFTAETPHYERAKERIHRTYGEEERGLAQRYAQMGRVGRLPQVYKGLARERGKELTGFTKELSTRRAERIPEEKARRITQAMQFLGTKGGAPTVPLGAMPQAKGMDWGKIVQGMRQDAQFWTDFAMGMQEIRRKRGAGGSDIYSRLGYGTQGAPATSQWTPDMYSRYYKGVRGGGW